MGRLWKRKTLAVGKKGSKGDREKKRMRIKERAGPGFSGSRGDTRKVGKTKKKTKKM